MERKGERLTDSNLSSPHHPTKTMASTSMNILNVTKTNKGTEGFKHAIPSIVCYWNKYFSSLVIIVM